MNAGVIEFTFGVFLSVAAILRSIITRKGRTTESEKPNASSIWLLYTAIGLMAFLVSHIIFRSGMVFLQGGDEYCRAEYILLWSQKPFFATSVHVWLPGQFYVLGFLNLFFHNLPVIVVISSLLGCCATVFFAMSLTRRIWDSRVAGLFAGILVGTECTFLWASVNPQAEVFFFPAFLAALDFWLAGWHSLSERANQGRSHKSEILFLCAAACAGFGTMFRFEMWYVGILLGAFLTVRMVWLAAKKRRYESSVVLLLACILLAAYPVAWMVSSTLRLGSPLGFAAAGAQLNRSTNLLYDVSSPLKMFFAYPHIVWLDHWSRLAFPIGGVLLIIAARQRRSTPFLTACLFIILFSMIVSSKAGIGSNNRARYSEFMVLMFLCIGAGIPAFLWCKTSGLWRWISRIAVSGLLVFSMAVSVMQARADYPHAYSVPSRVLMIMEGLEREYDPGRSDNTRIQLANQPLEIYSESDFKVFWMARYHSNWPEKVTRIVDSNHLQQRFDNAPNYTHILVKMPRPELNIPARAKLAKTIGPYELWEILDPGT